jgi:putative addiction module component (TIGR02574 family)
MASVFEDVAAKALRLSAAERARLVDELIRSLDGEPEGIPEEIAAAWEEEIARRVDEMEAGRVKWVSEEEVKAATRAILDAHRK